MTNSECHLWSIVFNLRALCVLRGKTYKKGANMKDVVQKPLHRFMLGVLVWFPITFFLWYVTALYHLAPIAWLSNVLFSVWMPDAILWLKLQGHTLVLASNFGTDALGQVVSPPPGEDLLGFHLNPLIYSYSLPLLYALILATPEPNKWYRMLWGTFLVIPTELFSMVMTVLKTLSFEVGTAFQQQQGLTETSLEFIALGYQAGTLIVPMIAPLIIWVAMHRNFIIRLAPQLIHKLER
jgi:hypothetical protein